MLSRFVVLMLFAAGCSAQESAVARRTITLPERTPVVIELDKPVSSADAKPGTVIEFHLVRPVEIEGVTVIVGGSHLTASIVRVKSAGRWKSDGDLELEIGSVTAVDGSSVQLRFPRREPEKKLSARNKTALIVASPLIALFALSNPRFLMSIPGESKKGAELVVPAGERFEVYVAEGTTISLFP